MCVWVDIWTMLCDETGGIYAHECVCVCVCVWCTEGRQLQHKLCFSADEQVAQSRWKGHPNSTDLV